MIAPCLVLNCDLENPKHVKKAILEAKTNFSQQRNLLNLAVSSALLSICFSFPDALVRLVVSYLILERWQVSIQDKAGGKLDFLRAELDPPGVSFWPVFVLSDHHPRNDPTTGLYSFLRWRHLYTTMLGVENECISAPCNVFDGLWELEAVYGDAGLPLVLIKNLFFNITQGLCGYGGAYDEAVHRACFPWLLEQILRQWAAIPTPGAVEICFGKETPKPLVTQLIRQGLPELNRTKFEGILKQIPLLNAVRQLGLAANATPMISETAQKWLNAMDTLGEEMGWGPFAEYMQDFPYKCDSKECFCSLQDKLVQVQAGVSPPTLFHSNGKHKRKRNPDCYPMACDGKSGGRSQTEPQRKMTKSESVTLFRKLLSIFDNPEVTKENEPYDPLHFPPARRACPERLIRCINAYIWYCIRENLTDLLRHLLDAWKHQSPEVGEGVQQMGPWTRDKDFQRSIWCIYKQTTNSAFWSDFPLTSVATLSF